MTSTPMNGHRTAAVPAEADQGETPFTPVDEDPLTWLPGARFLLTGRNKAPIDTAWNDNEAVWYTATEGREQQVRRGAAGLSLITGSRAGGYCWLDFDGEETNEDGVVVKSATTDFEVIFGKPATALPPSPISTSGRPGCERRLFRMPVEWQEVFKTYSFTNKGPTACFDFLYEKAGRKAFHAIVTGPHPDSKPGNGIGYRWIEGHSPKDIPVPDLPAWMLQALSIFRAKQQWVRDVAQDEKEARRPVGDGEAPMDLLAPGKQRKLLRSMQKFWPYRANRAEFAPTELGAKGHYDLIRRLVLSLAKGIGDTETMELWLVGGHWDKLNQWGGGDGVNAVTGGSLMTLAKSLMSSDADGEEVAPWAAAWSIAVENGWKPPGWALPPREINTATLTTGVTKKLEELKKALEIIDEMDSPLERECAYQNLAKSLDCTEKELKMLLRHIQEEATPCVDGDWNEVVKRAKPIEVAVENLLAFNALTIVASDGGVGKSVLIYRLAEAAANGGKFAGQLQAVKGKVLIVQKDESDSNLAAKNALMRAEMPDGAVQVKFKFNGGMLPELRKWIREYGARYVFMDSLFSLFGTDGDLTEGAIGTYMYLLNAMASEENCAILLTHHLRKADKSKSGKRAEVHMQDLYGSSFIVNGTSDVWGVVRDPESPADAPRFQLKVLKPRTGVTAGGDTYVLSGRTEDLSFQVERLNDNEQALNHLRRSERVVLEVLSKHTSGETGVTLDELYRDVQPGNETSKISRPTCEKALRKLVADRSLGIERYTVPSTGGRPQYRYWRAPQGKSTEKW